MPVEVLPEMTIVWAKEDWLNTSNILWRKRICIDLDGVVCEYNFPKIVKDFFGVELKAHEIVAYDLADVLGVKPEDINAMFKDQVFGSPTLISGALGSLIEWQDKGHELYIFSNRIKYMGYWGLHSWLKRYNIPFSNIDDGKGEYDVHIDDSPSKLMGTNSKLKLLFTQPWNVRCKNITGKLVRVNNWEEVKDVSASTIQG